MLTPNELILPTNPCEDRLEPSNDDSPEPPGHVDRDSAAGLSPLPEEWDELIDKLAALHRWRCRCRLPDWIPLVKDRGAGVFDVSCCCRECIVVRGPISLKAGELHVLLTSA